MQKEDVESLSRFVERPGMYIYTTDRSNIVSFIHGYELGAQGRCKFTEVFSDNLTQKFKLKKYATGWQNQIERYSESKVLSWVDAFFLLASEVLSQHES